MKSFKTDKLNMVHILSFINYVGGSKSSETNYIPKNRFIMNK